MKESNNMINETKHTPDELAARMANAREWARSLTHDEISHLLGEKRSEQTAESVRALKQEDRNRLKAVNAELLAACKRAKYLAACIRDASTMRNIGPDIEGIIDACKAAIARAEGGKA